MNLSSRPYDGEHKDFENLWRFLEQDIADRQENFIWHLGRIGDWRYGLWNDVKKQPTYFQDHAQLWVDDTGQLQGFVINEDGGNIFFIFTRQGYETLYPEILAWTVKNWAPRYSAIKTEVHESQPEALVELQRAGFRSKGMVATSREYDLLAKKKEPVILPSGFQIVRMSENGDYRKKGLLYKDGFSSENHISEEELVLLETSRKNPAYNPEYDFSVVAPGGLHVATCVGFIDWKSQTAEVEKVCTHRQYRRMGLSEAAIRKCFHHLAEARIEKAYIEGYDPGANNLYEKLGPSKRKQWYHYELK